jgi:subtilisin family serine protease
MKTVFAATLFIVLILATSLASIVYAQEVSFVPGEILVGLKSGWHPDAIGDLNTQFGARPIYRFRLINAVQLRLAPGRDVLAAVARYSRHPAVEYAEPNYIVHADVIPNDPRFNELWGLHNTGQTGGKVDADIDGPEAWDNRFDASAVIVADIDTGVDYTHPDLAANIWTNPGEIPGNGIDDDGNGFVDDIHGYDFANNDGDPRDDNNHGTHTSGTIGAVGNNGVGVTGVCWKVQIMALKFLKANGSGSTADAVKCLEYATLMGAHLSSNSWGGGGKSTSLLLAILNGPSLFVAAAGNSGVNTDINPEYPGSYKLPKIISVAATDHNDKKASFSNFGLKSVDLGAPGVNILSTTPNNTYSSFNGTSMATPHVAGVAALIMAEDPTLTGSQVKQKILASVDPVADLAGKTVTGGRLNAANALAITAVALAPPIDLIQVSPREERVSVGQDAIPVRFRLGQNYPNPFNPETWVPFELAADTNVSITIYDAAGRHIRNLNLGLQSAGAYLTKEKAAYWDGRSDMGELVSSGIYFYRLSAGDFQATKRMIILK